MAADCLDASWLERIDSGNLAETEIDAVARHLEECPACASLVHSLEGPKVLVGAARNGAGYSEMTEPPMVAALIRRLQDLTDTAIAPGSTPAPGRPLSERVLASLLAPAQTPDELGRLGHYRILKILGKGGMGLVLEAEDILLKRPVALKVILPQLLDQPGARERFLREARAAAALHSDHVVPIHQVGEDRGVPFLAMPLLQGETLDSRLKRQGRLPTAEVIRIGRETALGLAAAHARGLVHRDIKPSNLWLESVVMEPVARSPWSVAKTTDGPTDSLQPESAATTDNGPRTTDYRVKILDFGLARQNSCDAALTGSATILGTPAYMAPEQAEGAPPDARSDLFSVGCVLYQAATGQTPFKGEMPVQILRAVSTEQPRPAQDLNPDLPPDLASLIMQLLAKNPNARPGSAAEVAQKLRALETPASTPPTPLPRRRPQRRWLVAASLMFLLPVAWWLGPGVVRIATNQGELVIDTDREIQVILHQGGKEIRIIDTQTRRTFDITAGDYDMVIVEVPEGTRTRAKSFTLKRGGREVIKASLILAHAKLERGIWSPLDSLDRSQISPEELTVAGGGDPKKAPTEIVAIFGESRLRHWWDVHSVAFSADGKTLVSGSRDGTVRVWDTRTRQELRRFQNETAAKGEVVWYVAPSADGMRVASIHDDGEGHDVFVWNVKSAKGLKVNQDRSPCHCIAFSPEGSLLATGSAGEVIVYDAVTGGVRQTLRGHAGRVLHLAFSADGKTLASGGSDNTILLWELSTGQKRLAFTGHLAPISYLRFAPDSKSVCSSSSDGVIKHWDAVQGVERHSLALGAGQVVIGPEGNTFAFQPLNDEQVIWLFNNKGEKTRQLAAPNRFRCFVFSPDGKTLATGGSVGDVQLWDLTQPDERAIDRNISVALSPDGSLLATGTLHGTIQLQDLVAKETRSLPGHPKQWLSKLVFSPDGQVLASQSDPFRVVKLWDVATGRELHSWPEQGRGPGSLAFSPDGKCLASGCDRGLVTVWDVGTGGIQHTLKAHDALGDSPSVAFRPDGRYLLTSSSSEKKARFWDPVSGEERFAIPGPGLALFGPEGKSIVQWGDSKVRVRDVTGESWSKVVAGDAVAVSSNGRLVAIADREGKVFVWELNGSERSWRLKHTMDFQVPGWSPPHLAFSSEGRHLVTLNGNNTIYILRLASRRK